MYSLGEDGGHGGDVVGEPGDTDGLNGQGQEQQDHGQFQQVKQLGDGVPEVKRNTRKPSGSLQGTKKTVAPTISFLFVDQTVEGELTRGLQQVKDHLADATGYRIRISETSGTQLCRLLPTTNHWGHKDCPRQYCYTCGQEGEDKVNCKERNIIYKSARDRSNKIKVRFSRLNSLVMGFQRSRGIRGNQQEACQELRRQ